MINRRKGILYIVIAIVLLLGIIVFFTVKQKQTITSNIQYDVPSSAGVSGENDEGAEIESPVIDSSVIPNGAGISHPGRDISKDPPLVMDESWDYNKSSLYANDTVLSFTEESGAVIQVGTDGAIVDGDIGGIVLSVEYDTGDLRIEVGVQLQPENGMLGYPTENGISLLTGSVPFTYLNGNSQVLSGESCVLLGRTWDFQRTLKYNTPSDFGVCWMYDLMAEPINECYVKLRLYNIYEGRMIGLYRITIKYDTQDKVYRLSGLAPITEAEFETSIVELSKTAAKTIIEDEYIVGQSNVIIGENDYFFDLVSEPYWGEVFDYDGNFVDVTKSDIYGDLYAITVNYGAASLGPVTIYLRAMEIPLHDVDSDIEPQYAITVVGHDCVGCTNWDRMVQLNNLDEGDYTVQNYKP